MEKPILESERLLLRPFVLSDASVVQRLAGDKKISDTTLFIPHPYPDGAAEEWIITHEDKFRSGEEIIFAILLKQSADLLGAIGIVINKKFNNAEAGYWIGVPYWGNGYCSEALGLVLKYAFEELKLNKIHAHYMAKNPASGKVMIKNGMQQEGILKKHILKNGVYEDIILCGILNNEYNAAKKNKLMNVSL